MKEREITNNKSTCPISTILYHDVIDGKHSDIETELNEAIKIFTKLYPNGEYLYIRHKGENGKSDHIHLLLRNNTSNGFNNVNKLRSDVFFETCKVATDEYNLGASKPCANFRTSLIADWYGYALHSMEYFAFIGLKDCKQFHYSDDDVQGSFTFKDDCKNALSELLDPTKHKTSKQSDTEKIMLMIQRGDSDIDIICSLPLEAHQIQSTLKGIQSLRKMCLVSDDDTGYSNAVYNLVSHLWSRLEVRCKGINDISLTNNNSCTNENTRFRIVKILLDRFIDSIHGLDVLEALLES